jgi:hypothetical protein
MDAFDTFDGSKPNLINNQTLKDIESRLNIPINDNGNKVINGLGTFYNEYISPNLFPLIVVSLLIIYLTIKYVLKRDREEREEKLDKKFENAKKHMVKINPDDVIKNATKAKTLNAETVIETVNNISDMISDDYLITDEDNEDNGEYDREEIIEEYNQDVEYDENANVQPSDDGIMNWGVNNNNNNNNTTQPDIDRVAKIIFGQPD